MVTRRRFLERGALAATAAGLAGRAPAEARAARLITAMAEAGAAGAKRP